MIDKPKVKDVARGHWPAVLQALGIDKRYLSNRHGPCPICEDGTDRWRFDDKGGDGTWFCSKCGAGDGVKLVMLKFGMTFPEAAKAVEALVPGGSQPTPPKEKPKDADADRRAMNEVWRSGRPVDMLSVAGRYLHARTGLDQFSADLRAATSLKLFNPDSRVPTLHPGLIAMVRDAEGKAVNIHRTYLSPDGRKADVPEPRKCMHGGAVAGGAAIRLAPYTDILGIAEGIETALSAAVLHGVPCWAAVSALGLEQWRPPPGVSVVVFGDNDESYTGHKAAYALAWRLTRDRINVHVKIPDRLGDDWNDVLRRQLAADRAGRAA